MNTEIVGPSAAGILARAELDQQVSTAKAYPRSVTKFKVEALNMATLDQETAASCFYSLPRGGKAIEGPSIRLAEIIGSAWGNLNYGARVVSIDDKFLTAQGICRDLERNVTMTAEVTRRITGKNGRFNDDMIGVTANAACSIALRNAIFKVVPMAYAKDILAQARKVAIGDAKTLGSRRASMIEYFGKMGVEPKRILWLLEKKSVEDIGLDELQVLVGLATAIKDGDTTVDEAFPAKDPNAQVEEPKPTSKAEAAVAKADGNGHAPKAVNEAAKETGDAARAVSEALNPEEKKPEPQASAPIDPPVLTPKDKIKVGSMANGKPMMKAAKDCSPDDLAEALTLAQAEIDDPQSTPEHKAHAQGVVNLVNVLMPAKR